MQIFKPIAIIFCFILNINLALGQNVEPQILFDGLYLGFGKYHKQLALENDKKDLSIYEAMEAYRPNVSAELETEMSLVFHQASERGHARMAIPVYGMKSSPLHLVVSKNKDQTLQFYFEFESRPEVAESLYLAVLTQVSRAITGHSKPDNWMKFLVNWDELEVTKERHISVAKLPIESINKQSGGSSELIGSIVYELMQLAHLEFSILEKMQANLKKTDAFDEIIKINNKVVTTEEVKVLAAEKLDFQYKVITMVNSQTDDLSLESKIDLMKSRQAQLGKAGLVTVIEEAPNNSEDIRMRILPGEGSHPLNQAAKELWPSTEFFYSPLSNHGSDSSARVHLTKFGQKNSVELSDGQILSGTGLPESLSLHEIIHALINDVRVEGKNSHYDLTISAVDGELFRPEGGAYADYLSIEEFQNYTHDLKFLHYLLTSGGNMFFSEEYLLHKVEEVKGLLSQVTFFGFDSLSSFAKAINSGGVPQKNLLSRYGNITGLHLSYSTDVTIEVELTGTLGEPMVRIAYVMGNTQVTDRIYDKKLVGKFSQFIREAKNSRSIPDIKSTSELMDISFKKIDQSIIIAKQLNHAVINIDTVPLSDPAWAELDIDKDKLFQHKVIDNYLLFYEEKLGDKKGTALAPYCKDVVR